MSSPRHPIETVQPIKPVVMESKEPPVHRPTVPPLVPPVHRPVPPLAPPVQRPTVPPLVPPVERPG